MVTDLLVDAVLDDDATHVFAGSPTRPRRHDGRPRPWWPGSARLRVGGRDGLGAAFPAEGDPVGLGGPAAFNAAAIEAGEAVVVLDAGLGPRCPRRVGAAVDWRRYRAERRQLPDVGEADRALRAALLEAAEALARLDVARWRPEVADPLMNLRHRPDAWSRRPASRRAASTSPPAALQALDIVDLALEDDGGALTAYDIASASGSPASRWPGPPGAPSSRPAHPRSGRPAEPECALGGLVDARARCRSGSAKWNRRPPG